YAPDQALDVGGARRAVIDDEVGMLRRHRGIADAQSLQARGLDEARSVIAGRVGEHRAAAPLPDRLGRLALLQQSIHLAAVLGRPGFEAQPRGHEPLCRGRRLDMTVARPVLARRPAMLLAAAVDRLDLHDVPPGLAPEGAGVHRQRTAQRAWNAREKFRRTEAPFDALPGDARAGYTGLAVHHVLTGALQPIQRAACADHDARDPAVAHQQIASEPDPAHRHVGRHTAQEGPEVRAIARRKEDLGRAANVPGRMAAHRLVAPDAWQEFVRD